MYEKLIINPFEMLKIIILTGALALPLKRSLEIGGFGDDSVATVSTPTTAQMASLKSQRNE